MKDFEKNGLHVIISEDYLKEQLDNYMKEVKKVTKEKEDLQNINKSTKNIEDEFDKVNQVVDAFCNTLPNFIDMIPKTKANKFSKNQKVFLYCMSLKLDIHFQEYFSATNMCLMLETNYHSGLDLEDAELEVLVQNNYSQTQIEDYKAYYENALRKGITKQEDDLLKQKYGKDYKQSGNFLFLTFDKDTSNKKAKDFYFDKNLSPQSQSMKKSVYLSECKIGHLYKNKNGKNYLCLPGCSVYKYIDKVDYAKKCPNKLEELKDEDGLLHDDIERKCLGYSSYNLFRVGIDTPNMKNKEQFKPILSKIAYEAPPLFILYTNEVEESIQSLIQQGKTSQDILYLYLTNKIKCKLANATYAKQMIDDLGKILESKPEKFVLEIDGDFYVSSLDDIWVKSKANKLKDYQEDYSPLEL